jgi:hypothetical protein
MLIMMPAVVKEGLLYPPGANNEDVPVFIKFPSDPVVLVVGVVTKLDTSPGFTGCLSNPGVASAGSPSCRTGNRATSVGAKFPPITTAGVVTTGGVSYNRWCYICGR